uniref:Uncharacterized protein n=1 Tax=Anguilla anguilla TaxID=7936 RepID=A0A0E9W160_ANGAN
MLILGCQSEHKL